MNYRVRPIAEIHTCRPVRPKALVQQILWAVAMVSVALIKKFRVRTVRGDVIAISPKDLGRRGYRYWIAGTLFGLGWSLTGACPGTIFALIGNGLSVYGVVLVSALVGTCCYGVLRARLPHD